MIKSKGDARKEFFMSFMKIFFGDYSKKELKRIKPICNQVLELERKYTNMSEQ